MQPAQQQGLPALTSHHSRVEAPEAERQHFRLDSDALPLSPVRPDEKAVGVWDVGRHLVRPGVALLQSHPVVFRKPGDTAVEEQGTLLHKGSGAAQCGLILEYFTSLA